MLRILIPIVAVVIGIAVAFAIALNNPNVRPQDEADTPAKTTQTSSAETSSTQDTASDVQSPSPAPAAADASEQASSNAEASPTTQAAEQPATPAQPQTPDNLTEVEELGQLTPLPAKDQKSFTLGSRDPDTGYRMQLELTYWGAGVKRIVLSKYLEHVDEPEKYTVLEAPLDPAGNVYYYPFAARSITINGQLVYLLNHAWEPVGVEDTGDGQRATYQLTIADEQQQPVLDVVRSYEISKQTYDLQISQRVVNRTDQPLNVQFVQNIQGDLIPDDASYLGDRRQYVTGYFNNEYDPAHNNIYVEGGFLGRGDVVSDGAIWPNPYVVEKSELVWISSENRYFAVVTHPRVPADTERTSQLPALQKQFAVYGVNIMPSVAEQPDLEAPQRYMVFTMATPTLRVEAGQTKDLSVAAYAGPRDSRVFKQFPYDVLQLMQLIRYELGCFCTFQWLANLLLGFLTLLHSITLDWGVSIIILVIIVRLLLHPLTKRAQVNMMKMGKQMQQLQPEMQKLKEKYKDDQQKLNQEMMKLYREKGVNPANMLGCLPMFLQMPIWVALYAMLYFAIELRHEPAFYNVFHNISTLFGFDWQFLSDLSSPDHFIRLLDEPHIVPLLFIQFDYSAINILPILMGVIFFFQQRFTTPPAASDEMRQQQKIMMFLIPIMFPFMLYAAPSGLTLYILASTSIGVMDSWLVRRHVRELEESGRLFEKKQRKPGGFMDRISKAVESKQQQIADQQKNLKGGKGGGNYKSRKKR